MRSKNEATSLVVFKNSTPSIPLPIHGVRNTMTTNDNSEAITISDGVGNEKGPTV